MSRALLGTAAVLIAAATFSPPLAAAPLDDARTAIAQKQYTKVDTILTAELAQKVPAPEALRLSMQSALASGHIATAGSRITALLKQTGEKDPALLFQGAQIADLNGDTHNALLRYLAFARQSTAKSTEADEAFRYVLRHDAYPEQYKQYVALFGTDVRTWALGMTQLNKLIDALDADHALEIAALLIEKYPAPDNVNAVHSALTSAASAYVFGKTPKDRYLRPFLVMAKGEPGNLSGMDATYQASSSAMNEETRSQVMLDVMSRFKRPLSATMLMQMGTDLRALKNDQARLAAGKAYLAAEPVYAASTEKDAYYYYLRQILESPTVFNMKDHALLSSDAAVQKGDALKAKTIDQIARAQEIIAWLSANFLAATPDVRAAYLQKNLAFLSRDQIGDYVSLSKANWGQTLTQWSQGKAYQTVLDVRVQQARFFNEQKDKAGLVAAAHDYLASNPGNFQPDQFRNQFINSPLVEAPEKLAWLKEAIDKGGYGNAMRDLLNGMAGDAAWNKNPQFVQLKADFDKKPAGSDLVMRTLVILTNTPANRANPEKAAIDAVTKFLADYKGPVPPGEEDVHTLAEWQVQQIISAHGSHVWDNPAGVIQMADLWLPRTPIGGSSWRSVITRAREHGGVPELVKLLPIYAKAVRAEKAKSDPLIWTQFANHPAVAATVVSPFAEYYDVMPTDIAAGWLWSQREVWNTHHQFITDEIAKAAAVPGARFNDPGLAVQLISHFNSWGGEPNYKVPTPLVRMLWETYLAGAQKIGHNDAGVESMTYAILSRPKDQAQDAAAFLKSWQEIIAKRSAEDQLVAYAELLRNANGLPTEPAGTPPKPGYRNYIIFKVMKPLYEQIPQRMREQAFVGVNVLPDVNGAANAPLPADPKTDPKVDPKTYPQALAAYKAAHEEAVGYVRTLIELVTDGARTDSPPNYLYSLSGTLVADALTKEDPAILIRALSLHANFIAPETNWDALWNQTLPPLFKALDEKKADEATYAFLTAIQNKAHLPEAVAKQLLLVKAKAGTQIPGIIPVGPDDPAYTLYIAAHDLSIGDEQHAWELTNPRLKLLVQTWPAMDPAYVAWSVEQLRKQKMLKDGLEFAFNILLHEAEIDPDNAARILLAKADTYRDMENYQAARIEYEGLKANNRYNKTDAGAKAVYRLVDLYIITKDYSAAESLLEHLADSETVQKQADAYYLYAKMAFQKGDFKESRDYLRKVKERVLNHVEAALLEGELNLVLPGGLQNTEVAIGDARLSTVVIPGRPLTLTLQDPNLSIARGGAAIPVIITTSKGGDVEHVKLLPSSANKNLFTAKIVTALGKAQKDNLTLELVGDDVVSYEIEPEFQKANDLKYPAKKLDVRYDARLVASSGEILSEEEEEKRAMEQQLAMRQAGTSRRFEVGRDGHTVRPGSKIFVQITDFCRDLSDAPDKVKVDLKTGLGDTLEGVELTETGPHTGVFRGAVPTVVPLPRATASDSDAGHLPASIIQEGAGDIWTSLADGKKGKWVEVDTMSSNEVASIAAQVPHLDQVKDVTVLGMLADDYEELATFPARAEAVRGGLVLDTAADQNGETTEQIHRHLKLATTSSVWQESPAFDRDATPGKGHEGWQTNRIKGVFYLPRNRPLEFKWLSPPPPQDWLRCHILIDGQEVLDGHNGTTLTRTGRIELSKGPHTYELLVRDNFAQSKVVVGYKTDAGTFEPIPADWFSVKAHPELAEHLKPKGSIVTAGDTLTLKLDQPRRLRKLRLVFNDFLGTSVSVKSIAISDAAGKQVVPLAKNAPAATPAAAGLQIAPGDTITVSYEDRNRLREESKVLTSTLNSSYSNGRIVLAEEVISGAGDQRRTEYLEARRCRVGDQLAIIVTDFDEDTTENRDTVPVTVKTSSGERLTIDALETWRNGGDDQHAHAGEFVAVLKIGEKTEKNTIRVQSGDKITVSYLDKENTDPGIPIERAYSIAEAGAGKPDVVVYRTRVRMIEDASPEARARLKRLAGKEVKGAVLYKPLTIARHPDYVGGPQPATQPVAGGQIVAAVNAPLLIDVSYPEHVLNAGSVLEVTAIADSELKAATAAKREPKSVKVPAYVYGIERLAQIKGYPIQLESALHRDEKEMLRDGAFSGVIRLQIGSPGDPVDDMVVGGEREFSRDATAATDSQEFWYKVPTLLVSGSDTVHLRIKDDAGAVSETNVRLLSDALLELMDPTYTINQDSIHLGEKFHVKLTDPDHDISNERDTVKVRVRASSGADVTLTLNETLPHSGIFTGALQPEFIGEPKGGTKPTTRPGGETVFVSFGDDVTVEYVDDLSLASSSPVTVLKKGKILFGSDAQIAVFSKRFKDPEIAVKTRFLMAESLFEMAKEHRKLGDTPRADEEIARGKMILEEAIRDYPNTSLAAQGDYLLANLAQELTHYQEAVGRYSNVISTFPDSEYAAQSQFKKALCFEKLENYEQSVEEYVKLTYIYPESALVPDATVRLGNFYYKKQSFKIAAKIFFNFQQKNPGHKLAAEALFLSAQCNYKLSDYRESARLFQKVVDEYPDEKVVRPEAMYWLADSDVKANDNVKAFQTFKKVTWDYPESEWAKRARGRLTEEAFSRMQEEQ